MSTNAKWIIGELAVLVIVLLFVLLNGDDEEGALGFARLLTGAADCPSPAEVTDGDLALIFYTSGTTGRAKGVTLTHGNVMFAARATLRMSAMMGPPSRMLGLMVMPLANTSGHQGLLLSIARGTTTIVLDRFEPGAVLDLVEAHRVNLLSGTPTMFRLLWDAGAAVALYCENVTSVSPG